MFTVTETGMFQESEIEIDFQIVEKLMQTKDAWSTEK